MEKAKKEKNNTIERNWHLIDLDGEVLGRVSTKIAMHLMGKNKPEYTDNIDKGDFVVAINAAKIKISGNKMDNKSYFKYSGYPGGMKEKSMRNLQKENPEKIIEKAVKGMLPANRLRDGRMKRLKIYKGADYPYEAQFGTMPRKKIN